MLTDQAQSVRGKLVQAASFCYSLYKQPLLPACCFAEKSRYQGRKLACFARRFDLHSCLLGSLEPDYWVTPAFLPHTPAFSKALQLVAQAFAAATITAASAHAPLLTLAGLTTTCITHSIHLQVSAEPESTLTVSRHLTAAICCFSVSPNSEYPQHE